MSHKARVISLTMFMLGCMWWGACTDSPFDNEIRPVSRTIRGEVRLDDRVDARAGVYVWLQGLNLSARTDSLGKFELVIPNTLVGQNGVKVNGVFSLYFYVANYSIDSLAVVVRDGLFEYSQSGLDADGNLLEPIRLFKILTITTIVVPPEVAQTYGGPIDMQTTFRATGDSVKIVVPKSVGGLLGGIFFRHRQTGKIYIDIPDEGADTSDRLLIGQEPFSRRQVFQLNGTNFRELFLPTGDFEVIPYFFIDQDNMPRGLLESLGDEVEAPTVEYLKIPFRREGGAFRVF